MQYAYFPHHCIVCQKTTSHKIMFTQVEASLLESTIYCEICGYLPLNALPVSDMNNIYNSIQETNRQLYQQEKIVGNVTVEDTCISTVITISNNDATIGSAWIHGSFQTVVQIQDTSIWTLK